MIWQHKYTELDNKRPITLATIEDRRKSDETKYSDLRFFEFNERRSDGLFTKYVLVFNEKGENVTSFVRLFLDLTKYAKRQIYNGALMSGGYGFSYSSYLKGYLDSAGYKNYDQMLYDLMLDKKIWL